MVEGAQLYCGRDEGRERERYTIIYVEKEKERDQIKLTQGSAYSGRFL